MRKTEKLPDGTERVTRLDADSHGWDQEEFGGEAPADRTGPVNDEMLGTIGALMPPPSPLPQEEGHPPT